MIGVWRNNHDGGSSDFLSSSGEYSSSNKSFKHASVKIEFAKLLGEIETLIKEGRKKEALMALIAARSKLVDTDIDFDLREKIDNELNKLRQKIEQM